MYALADVPGFSPTFHWFTFASVAVPGRVDALAQRSGCLDGLKYSPTIRAVTVVVPVLTVVVSPTARPLSLRNSVSTTICPGPVSQWPVIIVHPCQDASPVNTLALTLSATDGTVTCVEYSSSVRAAPGVAASAAVTALSCACDGYCWPGPAGVPLPPNAIWACTVPDWPWSACTRSREVDSPIANITAVAPNAIANSVTTVRPGRANGAASPRVIGRGRLNRDSNRWAR